jgi:hypothetical protein
MNRFEGRRLRWIAGAAAAALALASCGGSGSSNSITGTNPADAVPASALGYLQGYIRPTGTMLQGIDAASQSLLGISNPGAALDAVIDKSAPAGESYEKDIRPWLGQQAGVALLAGTTSSSARYALVLQETNTALATKFISHRGSGSSSGSDSGITYYRMSDGSYAAVIGHFVVIANDRAALDSVIAVDNGAAPLSGTASYKAAVADELPGAAGFGYLALAKVIQAVANGAAADSGTSSVTLRTILKAVRKYESLELYGSASFTAAGALLDFASSAPSHSSSTGEANPIGNVPAGSWLAAGVTNIGPTAAKVIGELGQIGTATEGSGTSFSADLSEIQAATGINLESDLGSLTTLALFVKGTSLPSLEAGIELGVKDPSQAPVIVNQFKRLLGLVGASSGSSAPFTLGTLSGAGAPVQAGFTVTVPSLGRTIDVAASGGLIVIALGSQSLADALSSSARLSGAADYASATSLLGSGIQPAVILDFPQLLSFVDSFGVASNPSAQTLLSYLKRFGVLAVGTGQVNGTEHERIGLGPN